MTETYIPNKKAAPEKEPTPAYRQDIPNFADNPLLVANVLAQVQEYVNHFESQGQWRKFAENCDAADEMWRAAKTRTQSKSDASANNESTRSNVSSTTFYRSFRALTAYLKNVILGKEEELPFRNEPYDNTTAYTREEGKRIADRENLLAQYTLEVAGLRKKLGTAISRAKKYGVSFIEIFWETKREERTEKLPTEWDIDEETGKRKPIKFEFKTEVKTIADNPQIKIHDMKDISFDATIPDMQNQSCIQMRSQVQLAQIYNLQRTGEYRNVSNITSANLYQGETGDGKTQSQLQDRGDNAGDDADLNQPNGLYDVFEYWVRLPITKEGKWSPKTVLSEWHKVVFVGKLSDNPTCIKISPNPYQQKTIPVLLLHSIEDDKGAFSISDADLTKCLYTQETTAFNQYIDNITNLVQTPMIIEKGSMTAKDFTSSPNGKILWSNPGRKLPEPMKQSDATQTSLQMINMLRETQKSAMGVTRAMEGESQGSRTTGTETAIIAQESGRTALEDAAYIGEQLLGFVGTWIKDMWRQFGDPTREIIITGTEDEQSFRPSELWGPMRVKVTSVKNFEDSLLRRREQNEFLNQIYPIMKDLMTPDGQIEIFSEFLRDRNLPNGNNLWKNQKSTDALRVASQENDAILLDGVVDVPKEGEDHAIHIKTHKDGLSEYKMVIPEEDQNQEYIRNMENHIAQHENFENSQTQLQANAQPPQGTGNAQPQLQGEATGDILASQEGKAANLGNPVQPQQGGVANG